MENIDTFIKEAKDYTKTYKKEMRSRGYYHDDYKDIFNKKLAELIIQACINEAQSVTNKYLQARKDSDDFSEKNRLAEGETASQMVSDNIKAKFGLIKSIS